MALQLRRNNGSSKEEDAYANMNTFPLVSCNRSSQLNESCHPERNPPRRMKSKDLRLFSANLSDTTLVLTQNTKP